MKYEDFEKFVREKCMYETIYDDSDGRRILVIRLLDAYSMMNKKEWQGLADEEIREFEIWLDNDEEEHGWNPPENIVKYLEAKLKEKNT